MVAHEGVCVSEPAKRLPKTGRLLCFVLTSPKFYGTRVLAVNETWLPRCDHGQFFANIPMDPTIPHSTVLNGIPDDYKYLFQKSMISFHYAFTEISDQFDWYFKADDDTYVIMEHMYEYLATLDPTEPYYLGYTLRPYFKRGYNGGGAGYVLSRAALKLFIDRVFFDRTLCPLEYNEDVGIARYRKWGIHSLSASVFTVVVRGTLQYKWLPVQLPPSEDLITYTQAYQRCYEWTRTHYS
ncbi:unnamed protein product [Angiostrongylus costaricensis]|uniref:N-acetylgalactosaminide beta-1,3-galactosyltransferase n=1 Tax=Angiostrongylus costaricensis TaxID=334426 RepID=A0A3P7HNM7_ANGCS|nr:unnamed protein product [Angiostrongylus costaricensis]